MSTPSSWVRGVEHTRAPSRRAHFLLAPLLRRYAFESTLSCAGLRRIYRRLQCCCPDAWRVGRGLGGQREDFGDVRRPAVLRSGAAAPWHEAGPGARSSNHRRVSWRAHLLLCWLWPLPALLLRWPLPALLRRCTTALTHALRVPSMAKAARVCEDIALLCCWAGARTALCTPSIYRRGAKVQA